MSDNPLPFEFGVSEFTTMPWSFEEDVAHYAAAGIDAIEICEFKLDPDRLDEQFALVRDKGLKICAIQAKVRTFFDSRMTPDPKGVADRTAALKASIARLAPFAPGVTFITNTGAHPKGDMAQAMAVVTETLKALGPFAGDHGVTVALEPLNPTSVNVESAIWTVDQALASGTFGRTRTWRKPLSGAASASFPCRLAIGARRALSPIGSCPETAIFPSGH
jgi:sugar phosphate isomerase/epimerase